jgi:polyisoprenyl-phosphate glycosyltransferase
MRAPPVDFQLVGRSVRDGFGGSIGSGDSRGQAFSSSTFNVYRWYTGRPVRISTVIPIFNEADTLPELHRRWSEMLVRMTDLEHELVYVNDGSTDGSLAIMLEQRRRDPRVTIIDLSRNFGHQSAISAGLAAVECDAAVILDGDLQDPPEIIPELVACWRGGAQVVRAQRRTRQERGFRRWSFNLFYRVLHWLSDFPIPSQVGVCGLLDRSALDELKRLPERNRFLPGLRAWIGFDQRAVVYDRQARASGRPKQSFRHLIAYALDGVFSFSYKPLRLMVATGVVVSSVGFLLAAVFIVKRLTGVEEAQTGFTTLVTLVLFLGGVQLVAIGLLGEYLGRIYDEVKARPLFIVKRRHAGEAETRDEPPPVDRPEGRGGPG